MTREILGKIYDYPIYYDLIFAADWKAEFNFLRDCFERYATGDVQRVFEPACGTGRLLIKLAGAGFEVSGIDVNSKAVAFCNKRFVRRGFEPAASVEDMSLFRLRKKVDAAFNLINSFRHLTTEQDAKDHFGCMVKALRPGGIYALGLHLTPEGDQISEEERYSAKRGKVSVKSRLWTIEIDRRKRIEKVGMTLDVTTPDRKFRLVDEMPFRMYTAQQFQDLLSQYPELEIVATHDFHYEFANPITVDQQTEDVVYVLRRK